MALTSKLTLSLSADQTNALDLATGSLPLKVRDVVDLANGTGANQADRIFSDRRTIAASGTDVLDLAGVLTDAFGATITFARIKALFVSAATGNTNNVNVVQDATSGAPLFLAAGDGVPVRPGGMFLWVAPDATAAAVTAGSADLINVVNSGAGSTVTYDIVIIGASA